MSATKEVRLLLSENGGLMRRADHPELRTAFDWMLRSRQIEQPLPGVLAAPGATQEVEQRIRAAQLWRPDAVMIGAAAAWLGLGIDAPHEGVDLALPRGGRSHPGYRIHQAMVPLEHRWVRDGVQFSSPSWTGVWMAAQAGGRTIDDALRLGHTTPAALEEALSTLTASTGQSLRRFVVENSRSEPWSPAERRFHMFLRGQKITGWRANRWIDLDGLRFPVDVLFDDVPLAIEVMSWRFHGNPETFHRDNLKIAALTSHGWVYLPVTWPMLDDEAFLEATVRSALGRAQATADLHLTQG